MAGTSMMTPDPRHCAACGDRVADDDALARVGPDAFHTSCFMPAVARRRLDGKPPGEAATPPGS
jgi:hypothetical protein